MYVCPVCKKYTSSAEEAMRKHFLSCWKENHSNYKSSSAPRTEIVKSYKMNEEMAQFFGR